MRKTFIFTGSGGQGILSMGTMLAQAAVESGKHAVYMPNYGPEQRGGSARCVVTIDDAEVPCPMAEYAETVVAMSLLGYNKFHYELLPSGVLIYDNTMIPEEFVRKDVVAIPVPANDLAMEIGSAKVANVIVDGVLIGMTEVVSPEEFMRSLDLKFARKSDAVREMNRKAFECGLHLAKQHQNTL